MPKVSVIIPVYNVEKYLKECLDSIVNQTLQDIEIICIDDGSIDNSLNMLNEYARRDSRVIVIYQENEGQSVARNVGLKIAKGEYIYFMDSDDLLEGDSLAISYKIAMENTLDVLYFNADVFFETDTIRKNNKNYISYYCRKSTYPNICTGIELLRAMDRYSDYKPSPCLQFIKHSHIQKNKINFYEGIIHEDNLFSFQCIVSAERVMHIDNVFYHRRIREGSTMTKKKSAENVIGYFTCFIEMMQYCIVNKKEDPILQKTITSVFLNAKHTYKKLSVLEKRKVVWKKPSYENFMFELLVKNNTLKNRAISVFMHIPRKINFICSYCYEHGLLYTLLKIKQKIFR